MQRIDIREYDFNDTCKFSGKNPQQNKGTLIIIPIVKTLDASEWSAVISSTESRTATFTVMPAPDALVGEYTIQLQTWHLDKEGEIISRSHTYKHADNVYIIFNAWCKCK